MIGKSPYVFVSLPAHTTHANEGVYPANHASRYSSEVPVFPAAVSLFHPRLAALPVPRESARRNIPLSAAVAAGEEARRLTPLCRYTVPPARSRTFVIKCGFEYTPPAAIVAYATHISRGVVSQLPRETLSACGKGEVMPRAYAISKILATPTVSATFTVGTFRLSTKHSRTETVPLYFRV